MVVLFVFAVSGATAAPAGFPVLLLQAVVVILGVSAVYIPFPVGIVVAFPWKFEMGGSCCCCS